MKHVEFPGLGLEFNFSNIAVSFLGVDIYWYAICIVSGMLISIILAAVSRDNFKIKFDDLLGVIIASLIFGVIGARLYYVLFNLDYYLKNPINILQIRDGGLGIYGGLILGIVAGIVKTIKTKIDTVDALDYAAPFIALAQGIGRWGNFFNVEAYGEATNNIFRMIVGNNKTAVHPTFLYESCANLVIFGILRFLQKKRKFDGQIFLLYLMMYSFIRFFIEGVRSDSLMLLDLRISQVVSGIIFVVSSIIYGYNYYKLRKNVEKCQSK